MKKAMALAFLAVTVAACTKQGATPPSSAAIGVVSAENFWGSLAAQLGGDRVRVTSIISRPDTDPHDYEPTAADGRRIASAKYVLFNDIGYDGWMAKLLSANPVPGRTVLSVGRMLGRKEGDNPHRWYFPSDVDAVVKRIASDYKRIDPKDAAYFDERQREVESSALSEYHRLIAEIRQKYAGTPVGASESIFAGLAEATGLKLITPFAYMRAVSDGSDPAAQDKATVDDQIKNGLIKIFVFNSQNSTPDVRAAVNAATSRGIPTPTVTETLTPANASFQDWQSRQLRQLRDALARATGR